MSAKVPQRFTRTPAAVNGASQKPEAKLPDPPKRPKARSIATIGKAYQCAPLWISGFEGKMDIEATAEAVEAGLLPQNSSVVIPDFTSQGQFCVLSGWLTHYDKVVYRKEYGIDINYQVSRLLHTQALMNQVFEQTEILSKTLDELNSRLAAAASAYALAETSGSPEEKGTLLADYEALVREYEVQRRRSISDELGITFHQTGAISTKEFGDVPIVMSEEYVSIIAFVLSRHGRIVGVTEEWFKRVQAEDDNGEAFYDKDCFQLESVTASAVAEYIDLNSLFQPVRVEEVPGGTNYQESPEEQEMAFFNILRLAHLYDAKQVLAKMKEQGEVSQTEEEELNALSPLDSAVASSSESAS